MILQDATTRHISHRRKRQVTQEVSQENRIVTASNNSENGPVIKKKKGRTSTRLKRPPNGVLIPIESEGDRLVYKLNTPFFSVHLCMF
jgi:hypothetical protein